MWSTLAFGLLLWSVFVSIALFPDQYNRLFDSIQRTYPRWLKSDFKSPFARTWARVVGVTGTVLIGTGLIVEFVRAVRG